MAEGGRAASVRGFSPLLPPLTIDVFTSRAIHNATGCCDDKTQPNDGSQHFTAANGSPITINLTARAESSSFWLASRTRRFKNAPAIRIDNADRFTFASSAGISRATYPGIYRISVRGLGSASFLPGRAGLRGLVKTLNVSTMGIREFPERRRVYVRLREVRLRRGTASRIGEKLRGQPFIAESEERELCSHPLHIRRIHYPFLDSSARPFHFSQNK